MFAESPTKTVLAKNRAKGMSSNLGGSHIHHAVIERRVHQGMIQTLHMLLSKPCLCFLLFPSISIPNSTLLRSCGRQISLLPSHGLLCWVVWYWQGPFRHDPGKDMFPLRSGPSQAHHLEQAASFWCCARQAGLPDPCHGNGQDTAVTSCMPSTSQGPCCESACTHKAPLATREAALACMLHDSCFRGAEGSCQHTHTWAQAISKPPSDPFQQAESHQDLF